MNRVMLNIHSNQLAWQRNNGYKWNKYSITVQEFLNGNLGFQLDCESADMKPNYLEGVCASDWNKRRASG